jgi:hypothetical protein
MSSSLSSHRALNKNPLAPSLDELVHQHAEVGENETTNVEPEELGSVPRA